MPCNLMIYKNDSTYQNLLKHLQIVKNRHLLKHTNFEHLKLPSNLPNDFKYHSSCHQQIIRVKDYSPIKKKKGLNVEDDLNVSNVQENSMVQQEKVLDQENDRNVANARENREDNDDEDSLENFEELDDKNDPDYVPDDDDDERDVADISLSNPHPDYLPYANDPKKCRYFYER